MARLDLRGRTALVTGASSGMGVHFAEQLVARGVTRIILVARRRERLEALAERLDADAVVAPCDLTDWDAVAALVQEHPQVDILVNNAGFGLVGTQVELAGPRSQAMFDLNCRALLQLIDAYLPGMVERGYGGILNVGSTAGMVPMPTMALYGATKAFVNSLTDAMRSELKGTGVHASCLAPGPVKSEFFQVASGGGDDPPDFVMMPADKAARHGIEGLVRNKPLVVPGVHMQATMGLARSAPLFLVRLFTGLYGKMVQEFAG